MFCCLLSDNGNLFFLLSVLSKKTLEALVILECLENLGHLEHLGTLECNKMMTIPFLIYDSSDFGYWQYPC